MQTQAFSARTTAFNAHSGTICPRRAAVSQPAVLQGRLSCGSRGSRGSSSAASLLLPVTTSGAPRHRRPLQVCAAIKKVSVRNVACSKSLVALPGKSAAVEALCDEVVAFTKRRMAERDAGILTFECSKDAGEENQSVFHFWEIYESNGHLGRHNTTPEVQKFMEKVQTMIDGPIGMALYEWKDGRLGPASVQGGPRGEGGLDDATGASGAAGGASYKQTSATVDLTSVKEEKDEGGIWGIKFDLPWMKKDKKK